MVYLEQVQEAVKHITVHLLVKINLVMLDMLMDYLKKQNHYIRVLQTNGERTKRKTTEVSGSPL